MTIRKLTLITWALCLTSAGALFAQDSLGDLARRLRGERSRASQKPSKVYTNDNLPPRPPWESMTISSISNAATPAPAPKPAAKTEAAPGAKESNTPATTPAPSEEKPADKMKTKDYWQSKFKPLREQLTRAKEEQDLAENELQLLQTQLARELNPDAQNDLKQKISAKSADVEQKRATTAEVQQALGKLQEEFKESGAPEDWSKTE